MIFQELESPGKAPALIAMTIGDICRECGGELLAGSPSQAVTAVTTDTRRRLEGALFIGIAGERFDGADFIGDALDGGAAAVMAAAPAARELVQARGEEGLGDAAVIAVADGGEALQRLAAATARQSGARIVAVTGSSGKTSTKDFIATMLAARFSVVASRGSFNNEVGVPLTLLDAGEDTRVIVVEMGMQAPGEIAALCRIAPPEVAVITNVGPAHLEYAGSLEGVAAGKAEIAASLPAGGGLVTPYGEKLLEPHLEGLELERLTFGFDPRADVHPLREEPGEDGIEATIDLCGEKLELGFAFTARYQLANAMAAMAACRLLGMPAGEIAAAAGGIGAGGRRGEVLSLPGERLLIDDSYNANPLSMEAALEHLVRLAGAGRSIAVLGDMGELGADAPALHRRVGRRAAELGVDVIVGIGRLAAEYLEGAAGVEARPHDRCFADHDSAAAYADSLSAPGDVLLVKASRFMELERVVERLRGGDAGDGERG